MPNSAAASTSTTTVLCVLISPFTDAAMQIVCHAVGARSGGPATVPPPGERVRVKKTSGQSQGAVSHGPRRAVPLFLRQGQDGYAYSCRGSVRTGLRCIIGVRVARFD